MFFFRGELGFLDCDDICICVVNTNFEFVFNSVYNVLKYNEISVTFTAGFAWCLQSCGSPWSVCEVVSIPYVGAVVAVTDVCTVVCVACEYGEGDGNGVFGMSVVRGKRGLGRVCVCVWLGAA